MSAIRAAGPGQSAPAGVWAAPLTFVGDGGKYEARAQRKRPMKPS